MENLDVRWKQRFDNFKKAFAQLDKAVLQGDFNELERQGLIKSFEYTYELAWNTMRDFLIQKWNVDLMGSKDTIRLAFNLSLIDDGEVWMEMVKSRNLTSHTYNMETASFVENDIERKYHLAFKKLIARFDSEE
ncbi:nucleotidyltransferase substrate binding protein (TIGR01987 family) [Algoriphagus ratkowskyi]|uniref:Nucleotidyltransferase n=1 Tax=Algoriphagus ratkowskyi TaxID=57028 RepID=A0A2W7R9U1_9BACT|nr:nucleotidyltransferase substrate binding protein [Algoriphagus ratkowskyi]PZX56831.1 nucleotidyltransferase substrate binding protein (TIGR01987 family) [Algoriphagus ratkowskyi]TXD79747.1 nucleotidyltransferase [Algoriphagus ratkowskyi]